MYENTIGKIYFYAMEKRKHNFKKLIIIISDMNEIHVLIFFSVFGEFLYIFIPIFMHKMNADINKSNYTEQLVQY